MVIIGGGPGGYEAALVGSQLGGEVTLIDTDGLGGSAVLTDCVPSKTLIATAEVMTEVHESAELGLRFGDADRPESEAGVHVDLAAVNKRVLALAQQQSADICDRVQRENVDLVIGRGRLDGRGAGDRRDRGRRAQLRRRDDLDRHRGHTAGAARGPAGRRADPHLDPGLRAEPSCRSG